MIKVKHSVQCLSYVKLLCNCKYYIFYTYVARAFCTLNLWLSRSTATVNLLHADKLSELCISDSAIQPMASFVHYFIARKIPRNLSPYIDLSQPGIVNYVQTARINHLFSPILIGLRGAAVRFPPSVCIEYVFRRPHLALNMRRECGLFLPSIIILFFSHIIHRHKFVSLFLSF